MPLLSICITTYNRGDFIGATLATIVDQLGPDVELVIVDGASTDNTSVVVASFANEAAGIRYFREAHNSGFDADLEKAIGYASGEYCWLLSDDDFVRADAVRNIIDALKGDEIDLLLVEHDVIDASLKKMLRTDRFPFRGERIYEPADANELLADAGSMASFIGSTIIRRSAWTSRAKEPFIGSMFVHVGVIFQQPAMNRVKLLAEPLVTLRAGNNAWRPRGFEIWAFNWPRLIWGLNGYSDDAKKAVVLREPWRDPVWLLAFRGLGAYNYQQYKKHLANESIGFWRFLLVVISVFPGRLANFMAVCALAFLGKGDTDRMYDLIASSTFANPISQAVASMWLGKAAWHSKAA